MDMSFAFSFGDSTVAAPLDSGASPDWLALRAKLDAAWAARRELDGVGSSKHRQGSFDRPAASALAAILDGLPAVNPTALGDCKPDQAISSAFGGDWMTGGRGQK